jgi:4-hydroxyphenylpyruvate dioxygenase
MHEHFTRPDAKGQVRSIHHVEICVLDKEEAANYFQTALGFRRLNNDDTLAPPGDSCSIDLAQRDIRVRLTMPASANDSVASHIAIHGESVRDVALSVRNIDSLFQSSIAGGARSILEPVDFKDGNTAVRTARIGVCGDVVHTFLEGEPEIANRANPGQPDTGTLDSFDHVALAFQEGELDRWVDFYRSALCFDETHQADISTDYSAMRSKVMQTSDGGVVFPMMEPAAGRRKSQIQTFVEHHGGPGPQHLAFRCRHIRLAVEAMGSAGVEFLSTPQAYYEALESRVGGLGAELQIFRELGILADRDSSGLLLQIFSKPINARPTLKFSEPAGARPTFFLEVVERRGARGFGSGNIKALFEAVERAQAAGGSPQ